MTKIKAIPLDMALATHKQMEIWGLNKWGVSTYITPLSVPSVTSFDPSVALDYR